MKKSVNVSVWTKHLSKGFCLCWCISMKVQRGSKEWMPLTSLYHTRKQPRIKNLSFWDYCMNFPPSVMKDF